MGRDELNQVCTFLKDQLVAKVKCFHLIRIFRRRKVLLFSYDKYNSPNNNKKSKYEKNEYKEIDNEEYFELID